MKVDPGLGSGLSPARGTQGGAGISFTRDDFAGKLTIGQIIKGRVLRSYEGSNRYVVNFGGHEKIVDSALPLTTNELIVGRVIGLSERVELQRINTNAVPQATTTAPDARTALPLTGKSADLIAGLFGRFQAELSPADATALSRAVERAPQPETMVQSGLLLSKLGLPLTAAALRAVFDALRADSQSGMFALPGHAIELETGGVTADAVLPAAPALAGLMAKMLNEIPETRAADARAPQYDGTDAEADAEAQRAPDAAGSANLPYRRRSFKDKDAAAKRDGEDIARLILNVQSGGAVAHRVGTLPLYLDGRLVELNVALFEQPGAGGGGVNSGPNAASPLQHRQVVFTVTTELLGRIEVRASIAGTHMRVGVSADAEGSAQALARHAARLTGELESLGWEIDELAYRTRLPAAPGAVAQSVLEHLIAPGSVSALA